MGESGDILNKQLCDAVLENDIERAKHLLEKGASVDAKSLFNLTVLMLACDKKNKAMVDLLLKRGASINETDDFEWTALMITAVVGDEAIFNLLVEHNADVTKKHWSGRTVIHLAAQYNSKTMLDRLLLLTGQCCCPCPCSCAQWGLTVDIDDNDGKTPLWWAALGGHVDCVDVLLVHGANPDHKSENGKSPLDIAKYFGHTTVVSMMTEASERRCHQYVAKAFSVIPKLRENIALLDGRLCEREKKIQSLEKEKQDSEQSQERLREEIKVLRSQNEQGVSEEMSVEAVTDSVVKYGADQWYYLGRKLRYNHAQVLASTHDIDGPESKLYALISQKHMSVSDEDLIGLLLSACRAVAHPIDHAVLRDFK